MLVLVYDMGLSLGLIHIKQKKKLNLLYI